MNVLKSLPPVFQGFPIDENGLWIFGYGSLMWRPGFDFVESCQATLQGYHRSFCIYSHHHRGTPEVPGLVLGLDRGASCSGVAFRVAREHVESVVAYLDERELIGYAYTPELLEVLPNYVCDNDHTFGVVTAYTFVADVHHEQYAGDMDITTAAGIIMSAEGYAGLNRDYLINTVRHLEQVGYNDAQLHALLQKIEQNTGVLDMGSGI